ncbi:MAG TPA: small ribosomal subunit Rsm22 family protein [Kofleriaceae bacterium]|nr:small ribosomal subunit Rsm22 family protein [Kofleriaceae bacterium]
MTWEVPGDLEDAVYEAARDVVGDAALATGPLTRAIIDRSKRYTSERERLAQPADRTADLAARAVFFTVADAMKIAIPLGELAGRGVLPPRRPLRIVDVGAGCGAMSLGIVASLLTEATGDAAFEILAIDQDMDALRIAGAALRNLAQKRGTTVSVTTRVADVQSTSLPPADLVVLGTVLNELSPEVRIALVDRALAAVAEDGAVIIIEPALRDTSRALEELRDSVLAANKAHVFAPCTRRGAPCPMLANPDDWCHEDRAVTLPPRTAELARLTHLRDSGLKFSYLVLRHADAPLVEAPGAWRVVSQPFSAKGKHEVFGCSDAGRVPIRLLKRNRSDANRAFERARRGDVLVLDAPVGERVEIEEATAVERLQPAGR